MRPRKFYTVERTAELLRRDPETIRRWLRRGKLEGVKDGHEWRVADSSIRERLALLPENQWSEEAEDAFKSSE